MEAESINADPLSLPRMGQPAPPEGEPRGASIPVCPITISPSDFSFLTFFEEFATIASAQANTSSGCRTDPAEIGLLALTREPDTVNTVGGKDENTISVSHCTQAGLQCEYFFGGILNGTIPP